MNASCYVVTSVCGTGIIIITEQCLCVNTAQNLITSVRSTNGMVVTDERGVPITVVGRVSLTCGRRNKNEALINGTGQMVVTIGSCFAGGSKIGATLGGVRFTELTKDGVVGVITRCSSILGSLKNFVSSPLSSIKTIALGPISICFNTRKRAETLNGRGTWLNKSVTIGPGARGTKTHGGLVYGVGDCLISCQTRA